MLKNIGKGLKAVWKVFEKLGDIYIKIIWLPWNALIKLYHWVYDEA